MGVNGLFKELEKRGFKTQKKVLKKDKIRSMPDNQKTIVIDACAYASKLCYLMVRYGGCFKMMQVRTNRFVKSFTEAGFKLIVVVDGSLDNAKVSTWRRRRLAELKYMSMYPEYISCFNKKEKCTKLMRCLNGGIVSVKSVLAELFYQAKCEVIMSAVEADREAARICVEKGCLGVLSTDSDYLAFGVSTLIVPDSFTFNDDSVSFECYYIDAICRTLGISKQFLPLLGTLTGNDFVNITSLERFHDSIIPPTEKGPEKPSGVSIVSSYISRESQSGHLRPDNIAQWVQQQKYLSPKTKSDIIQSLEQYLPKPRLELIHEKGGIFCENTIRQWELFMKRYGNTTEKVLMQIVCDHAVYESPSVELGMPISIWKMTEEMRHNLYDILLGPIRESKPVITELSVSPLRSGSTPNRKPSQYTPDFSFADRNSISFKPNKPLLLTDRNKAMQLFLDACGVTDDSFRDNLLQNDSDPMMLCTMLVAHIVSKFGAIPEYCIHALLLHHFLLKEGAKVPSPINKTVPLTMIHTNASSAFLRVFTYVKALNIACCCPLSRVNRIGFYDGILFHYICNLLMGQDVEGSEMIISDFSLFNARLKWCQMLFHCPPVLERVPDVVEVASDEKEEDDSNDPVDDDDGLIEEGDSDGDDVGYSDEILEAIKKAREEGASGTCKSRIFRVVQQDSKPLTVPVTTTSGMVIF